MREGSARLPAAVSVVKGVDHELLKISHKVPDGVDEIKRAW